MAKYVIPIVILAFILSGCIEREPEATAEVLMWEHTSGIFGPDPTIMIQYRVTNTGDVDIERFYITLTITVQLVDDQGVAVSGNVEMLDVDIEGGFVDAGDIKDGMTIATVPTEMVKAVVISDFRYE